jgi:hypothetical protein
MSREKWYAGVPLLLVLDLAADRRFREVVVGKVHGK